jgi:N-methylhydantoinase A
MSGRTAWVGVDVGGTFTDAVVITPNGRFRAKAPSTYPDIGRGVLDACRLAAHAAGFRWVEFLPAVRRFGLGTTAITNVIATRSGLRVGLITTKGFEDSLPQARGRREVEDGWVRRPAALVEQSAIIGVDERMDRNGVVVTPIDLDQVMAAGRYLRDVARVDSIAVSFLWSFVNPGHEDLAVKALRDAMPEIPVTGAAELRPVIREYERTTLAILNCYCRGAFTGVEVLSADLANEGLGVPLLLCHSGGGTISVDEARHQPVWLAESGPAAGVAAAAGVASAAGWKTALTCDLGGTSFDVSHVDGGAPARIQRGDLMGLWTALPRIDVESVGAGGGSIAWIDELNRLRLGPHSAGSSPGPVCYGRGGQTPTLTDALVVLGYIDPDKFLGGRMRLSRSAAADACADLGRTIGLNALETAWGVREIALAEMCKATRARLAVNALLARDHPLVSYGGCGSLFTGEIARAIGAPKVFVAEFASVLSAYGAATMDVRRERVRSVLRTLPLPVITIDSAVSHLRNAVLADLDADAVPKNAQRVEIEADVRFLGQRWEVSIALPDGLAASDGGEQIEALFRAEYLRRYGATSVGSASTVELVALRAIGIGAAEQSVALARRRRSKQPARSAGARSVQLSRSGAAAPIACFDGDDLQPGDRIMGPALIDTQDTVVWVPTAMSAQMDQQGAIVMDHAR